MYRYIFITLCALGLQSCSTDAVFEHKYELNDHSWKYEQVLVYDWEVTDTSTWFDMELEITHDVDFRFQNQYVKAKTSFPDSTSQEQILSLELFDETGRPYGNCGSSACRTPILLQSKIKFPHTGKYQLQLKQDGREPESQGIHSIQLKILKTKK